MTDPRGEDPTVAGTPAGEPLAAPTPTPTPTNDGLIEGRVAGRWDILALVGTGGMGNVYRALDRELGEVVALKVLRRSETGLALDRFRDEVKLARRVTHVNVARTHDIGKHGDTVFLTMELVEGEPLTRRLAQGALAWREAVAIARAICAGVGAAHAAGVVHRDLKPDNVMLGPDNRVVVTDFGIAATHELARGAETVEVTGTPAWMAPEQLAGTADARSDVYAIGEIAWTMLTGTHPWYANDRVQVVARIGATPPPMARGAVPEEIAAVIERCLATEPSRRFADASALGHALAAAGDVAFGTPRPVTVPARSQEVRVGVDAIRNLGEPGDDFVAAGLVEDLIDMLGRVRGLRVRGIELPAGKDDLDVVVGGSLRRSADQVRITVRASGARDGFQIWSQRFDRRFDEILKLTDEVARDVATALSATAARGTVGRDVASDQFVVEMYLRARHLLESGWVDDPRPLQLYTAALERDPESPILLAGYASLLARRLNNSDVPGDVTMDNAQAAARRAIERGGDLAEPWVALSLVHYNQAHNVFAVQAVRHALHRVPGHPEAADVAGRILLELDGALDEGVTLLERAHWTNPRMPTNLVDLVRGCALRGDWRRVDELLANPGTESLPALLIARSRMALWRGGGKVTVGSELSGLQRFRWAIESFGEVLEHNRLTPERRDAWRTALAKMPPVSRPRRYFAQVGVEAGCRTGELDFAWEMLDEAVAQGMLDATWLDRLQLLEPLRGDPRFARARALVGARAAPLLAAWRGPLAPADPATWGEPR